MQPILTEAQRTKADVFVAFSYPPDTFAITEQARTRQLQPEGVLHRGRHRVPGVQGQVRRRDRGRRWESAGSITSTQAYKDYLKRHAEANGGREPDRWASPVTYASLQMLQQAIERVGKLDRAAVIKELHDGSFDTIVGKVQVKDGLRMDGWQVGQWQGGEFYGLEPASKQGAKPVLFPKPEWKKQ